MIGKQILKEAFDIISPEKLLVSLISIQTNKEKTQDIWKDSPFKDLVKIQSNNAGIVGETFIQNICSICEIPSSIDGSKTKKIGGGSGDGTIKDKTVEIKLAHQGCSTANFQHELGETPWTPNYLLFIDISPVCIYLTIINNFNEEQYKNGNKCVPYFPTKSITWRKKSGAFKLDTTVDINEKNILNGYTLKIYQDTDFPQIKEFINSNIQ